MPAWAEGGRGAPRARQSHCQSPVCGEGGRERAREPVMCSLDVPFQGMEQGKEGCVCVLAGLVLWRGLKWTNLVLQRNGRLGVRRLRFMCRLHVILAQTL